MKKYTKFLNEEEVKTLNADNSESSLSIDENKVPTIEMTCDEALLMVGYSIRHILSFNSEPEKVQKEQPAIQGQTKKEQPAIQGQVKKEQPAIQGQTPKQQPAIQGNTDQTKALPQNTQTPQ